MEKLGREIVLFDPSIVRWKVIALVAERTNPDFANIIDAAVRIQNGCTRSAAHRLVRHHRHIGQLLCGGDKRSKWNDTFRSFYFGVRPHIPGQPDTFLGLYVVEIHFHAQLMIQK